MRRFVRFYEADKGGAQAPVVTEGAAEESSPAPVTENAATENAVAAQAEAKKYDDKQVNDLIAKNAAKAQKKLLSELGITDVNAFKKAQAEKAAAAEAAKPADQKLMDKLKQQQEQLDALRAKTEASELETAALKANVPESVAAKIAAAAKGYEGQTAADKIAAYVADFPWVVKPAEAAKPEAQAFGTKTTVASPDKVNGLVAEIEAELGIKKRT